MSSKTSRQTSGTAGSGGADDDLPFDVVINLERLPVDGSHVSLELALGQLRKLASVLKVSSVRDFSAGLHVLRKNRGRGSEILVTGNLLSTIVQPCVITLEPVSQTIDVKLQRTFVPSGGGPGGDVTANAEIYVDLGEDDMPDEYEGNELDLGPFLLESLALEIDIYPRLPGARLGSGIAGDGSSGSSPFSVLKDLKKN